MEHSLSLWIVFNAFVIGMLIVDLYVFNRKPHTITIKESLTWTAVWIALAVIFGGFVKVTEISDLTTHPA